MLIATRIQGRGRIVARVSAVLGVAGAIGLAGHSAASLLVRDLLLQDVSLAGVIDEAEFGIAAMSSVFPVIFGLNLGIVLLAVATTRAGWTTWPLVVVAVLALVADFSPTNWNTVLHAALASVVLGVIAVRSGPRLD